MPCGAIALRRATRVPSLFGLAPGGACHAASIAGSAVRSYRTFSPLPLGQFSLTERRFVLCGAIPGVAPAGRYPAPCVYGARTFLPRGLSTFAEAAVQPTDGALMGSYIRMVKGNASPLTKRICGFVRPRARSGSIAAPATGAASSGSSDPRCHRIEKGGSAAGRP